MAEPPSSPPSADAPPEESLAWYKSQYEQLAEELAEFRESSGELEKELEKDLEEADKRERHLQERAEAAQFEADEWKEKCKKAKAEANTAQNALEKEITTLRDTNRTLQLKLRDIEVANDDFERQARNTTSSLEDMESKYNVAIERGVMQEEEIKIGEQEREQLRIEAQRLREELSDLKIEAEILQDKLKKAENRHLSTISTDLSVPASPTFEGSSRSGASSPLITTPPDEELPPPSKAVPVIQDPPSPPMSETSGIVGPTPSKFRTPAPSTQRKSYIPSADRSVTPKPKAFSSSTSSLRAPSTRSTSQLRTPAPARTVANRAVSHKIPPSTSLTHIRSLTAQMQRLEKRVQTARSKLPAPVTTTPGISPRGSLMDATHVPSTVTVRSRKRTMTSSASSVVDDTPPDGSNTGKHLPRLSTSGVSRLSFGPLPNRHSTYDPDSSTLSLSRPSSRASLASNQFAKPERPVSRTEILRPLSRTSHGGARTPMGVRPRSSIGSSLHGYSTSMSSRPEFDETEENDGRRSPSKRSIRAKYDAGRVSTSGIPAPSGIPGPRRQSGGRRTSTSSRVSDLRASTQSKHSDLGETY